MILRRLAALAAAALASASAFAWDADGHMVIANIALANLSPKVRAEAIRILAAGGPSAPTDFILVSTWADDTRNRTTGPWHYEDHHFRTDGQPVTTHADAENAVWAIEKFTKILADHSKPDAERAEALRYVIHFVGDIHQPLHATARDSAEHPTGDRGGNDYHLQSPPSFAGRDEVRNLHWLWDAGGGLFMPTPGLRTAEGQQIIAQKAAAIASKHPRRSLRRVGDRNPEDWALESFEIAKSFVYSTPEGQVPSDNYLKRAQQVSSERAAAAGYRLADLLNRALS